MLVPIRNILKEHRLDWGNWAYLTIVIMIPIYFIAKLFGVHNKNYELEKYIDD